MQNVILFFEFLKKNNELLENLDIHDLSLETVEDKLIPLARKINHAREKFHRKKLYCPWCKVTINHIECRNDEEVQEFLERFQKGEYQDEAKESLVVSRSTWLR